MIVLKYTHKENGELFMKIGGLQKMTLLDYPGHVACTVFLKGCNFLCPFCYNSSLIEEQSFNNMLEDEFFSFLESRKNKLDGVAITGGEPLLQLGIVDFVRKIKSLGFKVKLDTNGSFPELLEQLIQEKLVDYVAMDIKNTWEKYEMTVGKKINLVNIKKSVNILLKSNISYEFRTTAVKEFHNEYDFEIIGQNILGASNYFIQSYQSKDSVLCKGLHALSKNELENCLARVKNYIPNAKLRGIE
jgi:pyruvate formate lyase activating enzyme